GATGGRDPDLIDADDPSQTFVPEAALVTEGRDDDGHRTQEYPGSLISHASSVGAPRVRFQEGHSAARRAALSAPLAEAERRDRCRSPAGQRCLAPPRGSAAR